MNAGTVFGPLLRPQVSGWPTAAELVESDQSTGLRPKSEADAADAASEDAPHIEGRGLREWLALARQRRQRALYLMRALIPNDR